MSKGNRWLSLCAVVLGLYGMPAAAQEAYPNRVVKFVVPFPAGSFTDVVARALGERVSRQLGQPIIVDNRVGVNGILGTQAVISAPPDGYTVLIASNSHAANASLYNKVPYDPVTDFTPLARVVRIPFVLMVRPGLEVNSVADIVAMAKQKPGDLTYGAGNTSSRAAPELLKMTAGIDLRHINYRGMPQAITDLMSGQIDIVITDTSFILGQGPGGKLRAIAVTTSERLAQLPNIPTFAESGVPNFELVGWVGAFAPAGTPAPIVKKLNDALVVAANDPSMKELLEKLGTYSSPSTPEEFGRFVSDETKKWAKIHEAAKIEKQ
jgi:tripartite-type tricarboxylate transporter receptor subunit TctC